jgi:hypothetical protein
VKRAAALLACLAIAAVVVGEPLADAVTGPTLSLSESSAFEFVSGSTLYYAPTGSNSGSFTVTATASAVSGIASIDFPVVFGSDSLTDTTSPYSQTYSWTSSSSGPVTNTVVATDGDSTTASADFTLTPDTTAPSGQTVALSGGPAYSTLAVPLTLGNGTDGGAGIDTASGVVERASATLTSGSCGSFGSYATVTLSGGADTTVTSGNCYHYRYSISDLVGNTSGPSSASADARVDATAPVVTDTAPTEGSGAADQYWNSGTDTLWFRPAAAGSFTLNATASDPYSPISQVAFPDVSATSGWAGSNGGVDTSSPYSSPVAYTWTAGAAAPGAKQVTATSSGGLTATDTITFSADSTPPTGQTVALSGGPWFTTQSVPFTLVAGSDAGSGVDAARGIVERASATLTNGACGTFGAFAALTLVGAADTGVASGNCYRYQYKATDNVGNVSTASTASADAKIDTTGPTVPSLRFTGLTNTGSSGNVVYYRPSGSGGFTISAASSDGESGIASYVFPAVSGFASAGSGPSRTYSFSNAAGVPATPLAVTATNGAGLTSAPASFTLVPDGTPPTLTVRCNGRPCLATTYSKAVSITATATDGTGSGIDTIRFTTDGTNPTADKGNEFERGLVARTLTHLKVRAYDKAGNPSNLVVLMIRSAADRLVFTAPPRLNVKMGAGYLFTTVRSSRRAIVSATLTGPKLKRAQRWRFLLESGTSIVKLRLPAGLARTGRYKVVWTARAGTQTTSKTTLVVFGPSKTKRA